jgi:hypothetical protein
LIVNNNRPSPKVDGCFLLYITEVENIAIRTRIIASAIKNFFIIGNTSFVKTKKATIVFSFNPLS